jgi:anti-anti-sigma factor
MTAPISSNDRAQAPHSEIPHRNGEASLSVADVASESVPPSSGPRPLGSWIDALARRGLQLGVSLKPGSTVLTLRGRLDQQSASELKKGISEVVSLSPRSIDLDLGGVTRLDGMGLAALVWSWGFARDRGRELRLMHVPSETRALVTRMNLHHLLQVVEDGSFR